MNQEVYKKRIFLFLMIIPLVAVLVVGIGAYNIYMNVVEEQRDISMEAAREQLENRVDNVVYNINRLYLETAGGNTVKDIAKEDARDIFYVGLKDVLQELQGPNYLSDYVSGYSLVNIKYGWVLSNRGLYPLEEALNVEEVKELFSYVNEQKWKNTWWLNHSDEYSLEDKVNRLEVNMRGLTLAVKVMLDSSECDTLLLVNISMPQLFNLISEGVGEYGMVVLDDMGTIVYSYQIDQEQFANAVEIDGGTGEVGIITKKQDSNLYLIIGRSAQTRFTYIASYDQSLISQGARGITILVAAMVGAIILTGVVAVYGTEKIYFPVKQLLKSALKLNKVLGNGDGAEGSRQNEFQYIGKTMDLLAASREDMEKMLKQQKVQLQELLMRCILAGEVSAEAVDTRAKRLGIKCLEKLYVLATAVRAKTDVDDTAIIESQEDLIPLAILQSLPEQLTGALLIRPFWTGTVIFSILCGEEEENLQESVLKYQKDLGAFVEKNFNCLVYSGVSSPFSRLQYLREAYRESLEALKNNELLKKEAQEVIWEKYDLVFYTDFTPRHLNALHFDTSFEMRVQEAIGSGEEEHAFAVTDEFMDSLIEHQVVFQERTLALNRYLVAILSVAGKEGISANEIWEENDRDMFSILSSIYEWDQIRMFYKNKVIHPLIGHLGVLRGGSVDSLLHGVLNLVKETEGNITLAECAERLGYHPSYIWKVMTSRMNMTFGEYLAMYKLELAKKMLVETDLMIGEIAERLNYTSAQNFNRFFVKYEKVSPGKYRKMHKGS